MTTKQHAGVTDGGAELNTSLVLGTLAGEPEERLLPSGTRAVSFSLTVRSTVAKTTSVPMVWFDPPKRFSQLKVGQRVLARGSVVRRFYRSGSGLGSATEVVVADAAKAESARARRVASQAATAVASVLTEPG